MMLPSLREVGCVAINEDRPDLHHVWLSGFARGWNAGGFRSPIHMVLDGDVITLYAAAEPIPEYVA